VLRDPREGLKKEPVPVALPVHREEIAVLPKPWHRSFVQAVSAARDTLHVTNPCMQQLLQLWFTSFRSCFIPVSFYVFRSFRPFMLFVGRQEGHLACKKHCRHSSVLGSA